MEPIDNSFDDLLNSVHKEGVTLFESNNTKIPCILLRNERFNEIAKSLFRLGIPNKFIKKIGDVFAAQVKGMG